MLCPRPTTPWWFAPLTAGALALGLTPCAGLAQTPPPAAQAPANPTTTPPTTSPTTPPETPAGTTPTAAPPEEGSTQPIFTPAEGQSDDAVSPHPGSGPTSEDSAEAENEPEPPPRCASHWFQAVYQHARSATVAVEAEGRRTAGFVFQIRRHVVTTFDAVRHGFEFFVVRPDGARVPATVVAIDPLHDLAILDTRVSLRGTRALQAGGDIPLEVGDQVMLMGLSDEDEVGPDGRGFRVAGSAGRIHTPPGGDIEFDASVHSRNIGGPLLTCDGRVLGVARRASPTGDVGAASPVGHLVALTGAIGQQRPYVRNWELAGGLHFVATSGTNLHSTYYGAMLSLGGVYRRWLGIHVRATLQGMSDDNSTPLVQYGGVLTSVAAVADLRWNFTHWSRLNFGLGVEAALPYLNTTTSYLVVDGGTGGCSTAAAGSTCPVSVDHSTAVSTNANTILPMAELEFQFGLLSLYTSLATDFSTVQARFGIGIAN